MYPSLSGERAGEVLSVETKMNTHYSVNIHNDLVRYALGDPFALRTGAPRHS